MRDHLKGTKCEKGYRNVKKSETIEALLETARDLWPSYTQEIQQFLLFLFDSGWKKREFTGQTKFWFNAVDFPDTILSIFMKYNLALHQQQKRTNRIKVKNSFCE